MEIRRFEEKKDSFSELINLFRTGLGDTDEAFWNWKYLQNTGFDKQIMYIIEDKSEIVAMMGFVPSEYTDGENKIHKFVQTCDLVVRPDYRGQGLFYKIHDFAEKDLTKAGYEAFFGFPNQNSLHGFKKMNYSVNQMKNYIVGINCKKLIMHKLGFGKEYKNSGEYDIKIISSHMGSFLKSINDQKWLLHDRIRINLNKEFIMWRCESHMLGSFKEITVSKNGDLVAYFIILITKGRKATAAKIVNFDISKKYLSEIKMIADEVKKAIYSFSDMIDFHGLWDDVLENIIIESFKIKKITQGCKFSFKILKDGLTLKDDLFVNHIDTDL